MRKSSFPAGQVHPDWRESAAFSPIYLRTGVSAAVAATWRPSAAASFYTSWHRPCGASRGYFAQKRPSERAKSCVFSTIICKGGFPFLRYVSAGAAATFFAAFVPWPVFCFAKLHCIALPPPAFPRSVSILSCPSVLCLRTSNLSGLECFLLRSEQLVQHTFRCLQKAFGQKVRLCLPVGRFFDAPFAQNKNFGVRIRQKQRGMGGDEKLGIFADQSVQSSQKRKLTRGRKSGLRFVQQVQAAA